MSQDDSGKFDNFPYYEGKLGFELAEEKTIFRLWAPSASSVLIRLYEDGLFLPSYMDRYLEKYQDGHFETVFEENLNGKYYDYLITTNGRSYESADPYARSCGANGLRSMVINLKSTDPEGWENDKAPKRQKEDIIYEVHVKDFTFQRFSGISAEHRGKYLGLAERGTRLLFDKQYRTGLDYIAELGVTHVQLMPIFDFGSIDEMGSDQKFNWGYDPQNYNVPEGSYSTDPEHGEVRIRELKMMVKAMHEAGLRVVMDVVYNHTYHLDSCLFRTEPWYFYRQNADGSSSNGSGCGNDIASERPMVHRYILDSIIYWAEEYHIDGFRFDLMGLIDTGLMNDIREKLDQKYGKGEKLIYGEPWAAGGTAVKAGYQLADKNALALLDKNIGAFCDSTRDLVKGSNFDASSLGFANGGTVDMNLIKHAVLGWNPGDWHFSTKSPSQTITYLSSHDEWTLWDKLVLTMDENEEFLKLSPQVLEANRLAAAMYFTMQGRPFMLSGEEMARTKAGVKNSYCSPLFINRFDWIRTKEAHSLVEYYKGLIRLRKSIPALTDKSSGAKNRLLEFKIIGKHTVKIRLDNKGDEKYKEIQLIYTQEKEMQRLQLDGKWDVLMDGEISDRRDAPIKVEGYINTRGPEAILLAR